MNILYHHRTRGQGVEQVHVLGMVRAFRTLGHKVKIVSPPGTNPENECNGLGFNPKKKSPFWGYISRNFPEAIFEGLEILYNFFAVVNIIAVTRKNRFDLIYERYALFSIAAVFLSRRLGIPICLEVNDSAVVERNRNLFFFRIACRIEQWVFCHASRILTVSGAFKKIIVAQGVEEERVWVTPNAINPDDFTVSAEVKDFTKRQYNLGGKIVIGYVGGFSFWHRLEMLVDTVTNLIKIFPNIHCLLVGDGVSLPLLRAKTKKLGIEGYFTFPGKCAHKKIAAYISAMDVTILPDANRYCSPVKMFEYMAVGKPVVAPRLPNVNEIITPGINGVLFEPGNKNDFEIKLVAIVEDEAWRKTLGSNARRTVYEKHLWKHNAEKIINIFDSL